MRKNDSSCYGSGMSLALLFETKKCVVSDRVRTQVGRATLNACVYRGGLAASVAVDDDATRFDVLWGVPSISCCVPLLRRLP